MITMALRRGSSVAYDGVPFRFCPWCGTALDDGSALRIAALDAPAMPETPIFEDVRPERSDAAFQRLWTKYAALPNYEKAEWTAAFNELWWTVPRRGVSQP